jgi:hypothetical protein
MLPDGDRNSPPAAVCMGTRVAPVAGVAEVVAGVADWVVAGGAADVEEGDAELVVAGAREEVAMLGPC